MSTYNISLSNTIGGYLIGWVIDSSRETIRNADYNFTSG